MGKQTVLHETAVIIARFHLCLKAGSHGIHRKFKGEGSSNFLENRCGNYRKPMHGGEKMHLHEGDKIDIFVIKKKKSQFADKKKTVADHLNSCYLFCL